MIRVALPTHLRVLAQAADEVRLDLANPATIGEVLDALETAYPMLRGTIRDHVTQRRRPFVRFFACAQALSLASPDTRLPSDVTNGTEPFVGGGAMAGG